MDVNKGPQIALTDEERFPLLEDLSLLKQLKQDEFAPKFNFESGDRLDNVQLSEVLHYADQIRRYPKFWKKGTTPSWLKDYLNWCRATVPFYRNRSAHFAAQPTLSRADLAAAPWQFVSSECNLNDLLVYQTSGTTGPAIDVNFNPTAQACYLPQLQSILDQKNIQLDTEPETVAIALICAQENTLTYASLSTYLEGAGVLKINLNEKEWKQTADANKYLEKYQPQILTGDPFAFAALLQLKPKLRPKAMVSSAMKLSQDLKEKLEAHFQCLVLDIYSLTECRMIAYEEDGKYLAIRPELYLEIFHKDKDELLPDGEFGELVVSGGNNPFLPLIRYRTGDFCRLGYENDHPYLYDFLAREPAPMYRPDGTFVNNVDISRAMMHLPVVGFELHQAADYSLQIAAWSDEPVQQQIRSTLENIFGKSVSISIKLLPIQKDQSFKPVRYSSAFALTVK